MQLPSFHLSLSSSLSFPLFNPPDVLKVSDFGLSTVFRHKGRERKLNRCCGTPPYIAPEVSPCVCVCVCVCMCVCVCVCVCPYTLYIQLTVDPCIALYVEALLDLVEDYNLPI